jgi:ABC-type uncharacterized transport system permease subunit
VSVVTSIAFYLGLVVYTIAATLFFVDLARREVGPIASRWAPRLLMLALGFHAAHVVAASLLSNICPVESVPFVLSLAALITNATYLLVRERFRLHALGAFVAPLALVFLVAAEFVAPSASPPESISRTLLALHVTANLAGMGLFLFAGGISAFYLIQEGRLKGKKLSAIGKLPPLDALDRIEYKLLLIGFPLLTFGVVSGAVFINRLGALVGPGFLRAILGYAAWGLIAAVLVLRGALGWRGRRAAYGTLAAVVSLLLVVALYVFRPGIGGWS